MVAEKSSVCRFAGQLGDDPADVVDETHVEHPVGFVEDQDFDAPSATPGFGIRSMQPARRGDENVDAVRRSRDLAAIGTPPMTTACFTRMAAIGREALGDLGGQFAGRGEHEHAAALLRGRRVEGQAVENRQGKGGRLAGSGLGHAEEVAAGKGDRYGGSLNRCRGRVMRFGEGTSDGLGDAERRK